MKYTQILNKMEKLDKTVSSHKYLVALSNGDLKRFDCFDRMVGELMLIPCVAIEQILEFSEVKNGEI